MRIFVVVVLLWSLSYSLFASDFTFYFVGFAKNYNEDLVFRERAKTVALNHFVLKKNLFIFTYNLKWDLPGKRFLFPINEISIEKRFSELKNKMSEGDRLLIILDDHGFSPFMSSNPLSGGIALRGGQRIHFSTIKNLIEKYVPRNVSVRIIADHCYSGGVHHISFSLSNVCSASIGSFRNISFFTLEDYKKESKSSYFYGVWPLYQNDSLSLVHWSGVSSEKNIQNILPSLSSLDYVEKTIEKGAYQKDLNQFWIKEFFLGPNPIEAPETIRGEMAFYLDLPTPSLVNFNTIQEFIKIDEELLNSFPPTLKSLVLMAVKDIQNNGEFFWKGLGSFMDIPLKNDNRLRVKRAHFSQFIFDLKIVRAYLNTLQFLKSANKKQLEKYQSLVKCEESSLF